MGISAKFLPVMVTNGYIYASLRSLIVTVNTAQKMKFSINEFFSKCDQILSFLQIWSRLLKKFLMENFFFCAVTAWEKFGIFMCEAGNDVLSDACDRAFCVNGSTYRAVSWWA